MNNPVKIFIVFFLAIFLFGGCGLQNKNVKIGLLIHSLERERWKTDRDFLINKVEELGGKTIVKVADNDAEKQLAQAKEMLANGVGTLVVIPVDQFAAAEIVKEAHALDVKVISYDRLIKNCALDQYVSTDNVEIGTLQAAYLTTIKPKGNYALIGGAMSDNNSQQLYLGQRNVLQPLVDKGDINIVYNEFSTLWSEKEGYEHASKLFSEHEKPDAIIAGNDDIAMGVLRKMNELGVKDVLLAGMDADLRNLKEIAAGHQTCTVYKPYSKMATAAAELAVKFARGETVENTYQTVSNGEMLVPAVFFNGTIVNKENLKQTVVAEGYHKADEIFK